MQAVIGLTARVDNNAIGDGFQLYLHSFVISASGEWAVVQQGMNPSSHLARRYHWHSAEVRDFTSNPHTAILGWPKGIILNLVDARASHAQQALLNIAKEPVDSSLTEFRKLTMPTHHDVRPQDVDLKRLGAVLAVAHDQELRDFASLLLVEGLGPRTRQSLALIAEVVHGAPSRCNEWFTLWVFSAVPVQELSNGEYLIAFDDAGGVAFDFGVSAAK